MLSISLNNQYSCLYHFLTRLLTWSQGGTGNTTSPASESDGTESNGSAESDESAESDGSTESNGSAESARGSGDTAKEVTSQS